MSIADNIRKIRTHAGLTQDEFGKIAGVSNMAVSQWENGRATPRMGAVQMIADYFGINKSEIIDDETADSTPDLPGWRAIAGGVAAMPRKRTGLVHAGTPSEEPEDGDTVVMVPANILENHPSGYVLKVVGTCMNRVIPEGYDIVVDPLLEPRNGNVVVVRLPGGEAVVRRWLKGGQTLVLAADSFDEYEDIVLRWDDGPVKVHGVVVWAQAPIEY